MFNLEKTEKKEEISLWIGEQIKRIKITEEEKRRIFNHNILVHLLYLDNPSLFLAIKTSGQSPKNYQKLLRLFKKNYPLQGDYESILSCALDTLLDFGIFKAFWKKEDKINKCIYRRLFVNRNELFDIFRGYSQKLEKKLTKLNFHSIEEKLVSQIFLNEVIVGDSDIKKIISLTEKDLEKFFSEILNRAKGKKFILLPTLRKGAALLEHFIKGEDSHQFGIDRESIRYTISPSMEDADIIFIFDDAADKGKTLKNYVKDLLDQGVKPSKIYLAVFVINSDNYPNGRYWKEIGNLLGGDWEKRIINYTRVSKNRGDFYRKVADIIAVIGSYGSIIDTDHLMIEVEFEQGLRIDNIMKSLSSLNIGSVLEPGSWLEYLYPGRKKITINGIDYEKFTEQKLHKFIKEIDQCKIRMIWKYNNNISRSVIIAPIINPVIEIEKRKIRSLAVENGDPCERCRDDLIYEMSKDLLLKFFEKFAETIPSKIQINKIDVRYIELEERYGEEIKNKLLNFEKEIQEKFS